jgi:hypothetical protein
LTTNQKLWFFWVVFYVGCAVEIAGLAGAVIYKDRDLHWSNWFMVLLILGFAIAGLSYGSFMKIKKGLREERLDRLYGKR